MSISGIRSSAPNPQPSPSNSYRIQRGAVAALGAGGILLGATGLVGDFKNWRETTTVVTRPVNGTRYLAKATIIDAESFKLMPEEKKKALITSHGAQYEIDHADHEILQNGIEFQTTVPKRPASGRENYLKLASVVTHIGEIVLGIVALNASRK